MTKERGELRRKLWAKLRAKCSECDEVAAFVLLVDHDHQLRCEAHR